MRPTCLPTRRVEPARRGAADPTSALPGDVRSSSSPNRHPTGPLTHSLKASRMGTRSESRWPRGAPRWPGTPKIKS
eukprot:2290218-Pyramimonas_sp.AAC.1